MGGSFTSALDPVGITYTLSRHRTFPYAKSTKHKLTPPKKINTHLNSNKNTQKALTHHHSGTSSSTWHPLHLIGHDTTPYGQVYMYSGSLSYFLYNHLREHECVGSEFRINLIRCCQIPVVQDSLYHFWVLRILRGSIQRLIRRWSESANRQMDLSTQRVPFSFGWRQIKTRHTPEN